MKKNILLVLITAIIFTGIGALATTAITANQITYTKNGTDTTVQDALDNIYTKYSSDMTFFLRARTFSTSLTETTQLEITKFKKYYKYFEITEVTPNANASECAIRAWSYSKNVVDNINLNQKYEIYSLTDNNSYTILIGYAKSNSSSNLASCEIKVKFSN